MHKDGSKTLEESVENVELPQWLTECLPEIDESTTVTAFWNFDSEKVVVKAQSGDVLGTFDDPNQAVDALRDENGKTFMLFDRSLESAPGVSMWSDNSLFLDAGKNHTVLVFGRFDIQNILLLKNTYLTWTDEIDPEWRADQQNWVKSYNWLNCHPVSWTRSSGEKTVHWETDSGTTGIYAMVGVDKEGSTYVGLEYGAHAEHDVGRHHYHDFRLDVYGVTFEEAYVNLAKAVDKFYNIDGTEKIGVEYEKSKIELELEERMKDFENWSDTDSDVISESDSV